MKISQKEESYRVGDYDPFGLRYISAVRIRLGHNRKKCDEYLNILRDNWGVRRRNDYYDPYHDDFIYRLKARVKELLKGHTDLILGFNIFLPEKHQFTLPLLLQTTGKKVKVEENCELPWDVLDILCKALDFDSHFQFAGVCKSWRIFHKIYWRNFLASQEPLLLQTMRCIMESSSFISIPNQKVYSSEMLKCFFQYTIYITSSSGYFILKGYNKDSSFMLINPFTSIKKVIDISTCQFNSFNYAKYIFDHALLAFDKCSEEFILVYLCKYNMSLYVYQSRNHEWVAYSTIENLEKVVDFVVLHDMIYVVTDKANIGVLNLNCANIKFLKLKNTPDISDVTLRLVNCDEQLLVVALRDIEIRNVYKIDFSTMEYVRLETLGDIALFYVKDKHCYALSNPNKWGYDRNSIYVIKGSSIKYGVYSRDENKLQKDIKLPPLGTYASLFDWYFRHLKYEIDYSLVE